MTYTAAKRKIWYQRATGAALFAALGLSVVISLLKFLYLEVGTSTDVPAPLARLIIWLASSVYAQTQWIPFVWEYAPVPRFHAPLSSETVWFAACYFGVFVGVAMFRSGNALARRLLGIEKGIEDELIRASISGGIKRTKHEVLQSLGTDAVSRPSIWERWLELVVLPVVVAVLAAAIAKQLGLT